MPDFTLSLIIEELLNIENHKFLLSFVTISPAWNSYAAANLKGIYFLEYIYYFLLRVLDELRVSIRKTIIWWFLPYISILFISQREKRLKKEYLVSIVDVICFLALFFFAYQHIDGICHIPDYYYAKYTWCTAFSTTLKGIGILCSLFYSFCFNFRLLKKYLVVLKLQKYEKLIFWLLLILLCISCYLFLFIYLTWMKVP